ncbi:MAG: glycerol-3-phosphate acyltransferase [Chloroflexi bacterium]|nr:glycerol-3-phosphate acyltransferase [Chloroflexota bacterium]
MQLLIDIGLVVLGYLIGSIPSGLIIVKLKTGKDIRQVESGRTGGTNAMRAAGFWAGLLTAFSDILKGIVAVWLAQWLSPANHWVHILAPIAAILGHNYSLYLPDFDENGRFKRFRGGAGGAPALGGAIGLWAPSVLIILPLGALVFFSLGYASVTTLSVAFFAIIVMAVRLAVGAPGAYWTDVVYGVVAGALLTVALLPNIKKLLSGTERVVNISLHGRIKARKELQRDAEEALDDVE